MLFSIASYLGLDTFSGAAFTTLFGWISLLLALPVFFYSAADYWRSAWASLRQKFLSIEVPIAAGIAALFGQSAYEVFAGRGGGYFDSLAGLLFFLLCGKLFQQKSYERLAFDRDYKSFFPLSVTRKVATQDGEDRVSLSEVRVGDRLVIRNNELIPADASLIAGTALIDYSFVTGESEPVEKRGGDYLYAGGRQLGGALEIQTAKPVSQSYLTSLWDQEAFRKEKSESLDTLTNRYSQRFTKLVITIAIGAAIYWCFVDSSVALKAFTSVLIVACPCALALAAPFALGTAQRVLAQQNLFLKNASVVETLARVSNVVFDKTGTLTAAGSQSVVFEGAPLTTSEERWLKALTQHSTHPYAVRIGQAIAQNTPQSPVLSFHETPGCGMGGTVEGNKIWMGSAAWLASHNVAAIPGWPRRSGQDTIQTPTPAPQAGAGSVVHVAINGEYRGCYVLTSALRPQVSRLVHGLSGTYELALLSGDNERERERFTRAFGNSGRLHFNQSPTNKLEFIRELRASGKIVMMVGDGLNDAGALKQSDVGVAVVENISAFSPASDVIMTAEALPRLYEALRFSKAAVRVVRVSFLLSSIYNVVGVSIAARGLLAPIVCSILMPLSSVTVVAFACGLTTWLGRRVGCENLSEESKPAVPRPAWKRGPASLEGRDSADLKLCAKPQSLP
jgi:Cu+-exporting ATPase